ncbi:MAG: RIP metalloprotease RseP [Candidatus Wallbacteria bacterium]|nr:RIP metalloprotease RseP [Candidatus Wallbacteria bacterium]
MATFLVFVPVIFMIVLAHEFGHFITAIWAGVRVKEFSLGFGGKIFGRKIGHTEYNIRPFPLGGYVELAGTDPKMSEEEKDIPESEMFCSKSVLQRFIILAAGSCFNFLLALLLFAVIFVFIGIPLPRYTDTPTIGSVFKGQPAAGAKLQSGDMIVEINGEEVKTWDRMSEMIKASPLLPLKISYLRGEERLNSIVVPEQDEKGAGKIGIQRGIIPVVGEIIPGKPADKVGIKAGDRMQRINGETVRNWDRAVEIINANVNNSLKIELLRGNEVLSVLVTPEYSPELEAGIIGIGFEQEFIKNSSPLEALEFAWSSTWTTTYYTFSGIIKPFRGKISVKNISGPVGIAEVVKNRADKGIAPLLHVIAALSINIGLLNLFPFPALDGGRLVFLLLELVFRRRVSVRIEETVHQVGLYALIFLLILITYRDVMNFF